MRILTLSIVAGVALAAPTSAISADLTCARTAHAGFICFKPNGIVAYTTNNSPLRFGSTSDIARCGDRIAVLAQRRVYLFDGEKWGKPVEIVGKFGRRVACGPKGTIWVLGPESVASWDGKGWKVHSRRQMFGADTTKAGFMGSVAAGPNGTALVLGSRMAALYNGKTWRLYKAGQGFARRRFLSRAYIDPSGNAWITGLRGLYTLKGDTWETVPGPRGTSFLTGGKQGSLWIGGTHSVFHIAEGRVNRLPVEHGVRNGSEDSQGRLWLATYFGLLVRVGDKWEARQMHNSDLPDNTITKIVSTGAGGTIPASKQQPNASIKGRMQWGDEKKIANAEMELCGSPNYLIRRGSTPCDGKPLAYKTRTDADGRFEIKNITPAVYRIAIKPEGRSRWILLTLGRRGLVLPGAMKNTGTIQIATRSRK